MPSKFEFVAAERGFIIYTNNGPGLMGGAYAFSTIEEAAQWVLETYSPEKGRDA